MNGRIAAAALAVAALTPAGDADAMQLELSRHELCAIADIVVVARVDDLETHWSSGAYGGLERHAFLSIDRVLVGKPLSGLTLLLPGGTLGDFYHWVEDVPELEVGPAYALFLKKSPVGWVVIGGEAGAIRIATDTSWQGETVENVAASLEGCRG